MELDLEQVQELLYKEFGAPGRMMSGSKSYYHERYPDHFCLFNGNLVIKEFGKVWFGDIDINFHGDKLKEIAKKIGSTIYVLYEMDARFGNEDDPIDELISRARWHTERPDYKPIEK